MPKLIILCQYDPMARMRSNEIVLDEDYNESHAELRALRWLTYRPNDLVMLVDVEDDVCQFCGKPIQEKAGWIVHKWVHRDTGAYMCFNSELTQAEPKEKE